MLGAQAVGRGGVDKRIDVLAMAIQKGATVYDLEEAELCYAPQYGSAKDPVNMAGFVAANVFRGDVGLAHWTDWQAASRRRGRPLVLDVRAPDGGRRRARSRAASTSPWASSASGSASCRATARSGSTAASASGRTTPAASCRKTVFACGTSPAA